MQFMILDFGAALTPEVREAEQRMRLVFLFSAYLKLQGGPELAEGIAHLGLLYTAWRVGDPFYIQVALGILIWLGLYLRESRLKPLVPLRKEG